MRESSSVNLLWETIRSPQTYKNLGYLMLVFPTGLFYFIALITGASLGMGMLVIGIGLLFLWLTFGGAMFAARFERWLANTLLGASIPATDDRPFALKTISKGDSWRSILYLFLKFPLGLISFIFTTTVLSFVLALITMPFSYGSGFISVGAREIDSLLEALIASGFGLLIAPVALLLLNRIATMWRRFTTSMLVSRDPQLHARNRAVLERELYDRLTDSRYDDLSDDEYELQKAKRKDKGY